MTLRLAVFTIALLAGTSISAADTARQGRLLYHGVQAFAAGDAATATRLPVEMAACARCHGARGEGAREGGVTAPPLRWAALMHARDGLPAFTSPHAVHTAIAKGRGRDGRVLDAAMPRFVLREDEARELLNYLQRVGSAEDVPPGVSANEIRLGVIAPLSGPSARTGYALVTGLRNAFALANRNGGVHGRRIALLEQDSAQGVSAALHRLQAQSIFALVGGLWNEDAAQVEPHLAAAHLAHVATLVVRSQAPATQGWSADLMPPLARQQSLLTQTLTRCANKPAVAIVQAGGTPPTVDATSPILWRTAGSAAARAMRGRDAGCVGYTLAQAPQVQPLVPASWSHSLVLPVPATLFERGGADQNALWQRLGTLAAQLTVELLSRAGTGLHERALLDQLDRLAGYELPAGTPLQFSRTQRFGWEPRVLQFFAEIASTRPGSQAMNSMKGD